MSDIMTLLVDYLGEPVNQTQQDLLYFFAFFVLIFVVSCIFDILTNLTKL